MKKTLIELGDLVPGPGALTIDMDAFCAHMDGQRLLATATSGAGKTHMVRRILEQTHGFVPQMVIDPEGEFSTLRSKYPDYLVLGGDQGDKPLHVEHAHTLALMLMDLRANVVLDLFNFKPQERRRFVANFVQAMVDAPKELRSDLLLLIDEAQLFAPQDGAAESLDAIIAAATRGRKRGIAMILATLRLAMISKDVASMCRNKLIGGFDMDLDLKRAAAELGLGKEGPALIRSLARGEFLSYGRIFSGTGIQKVKIGGVETGKVAGRRAPRPVAPDAKIKAALGKLAALPQRAAQEVKDLGEAKGKIRELEGQLRAAKLVQPKPVPVAAPLPDKAKLAQIEARIRQELQKSTQKAFQAAQVGFKQELNAALRVRLGDVEKTFLGAIQMFGERLGQPLAAVDLAALLGPAPAPPTPVQAKAAAPRVAAVPRTPPPDGSDGINNGQQKILNTIAMLDLRGLDHNREMVARWLGLHPNGGTYGQNLAKLRQLGYMEPSVTKLTAAGRGQADPLPTGLDHFKAVLAGAQRKIVDVLAADRSIAYDRESLAAALELHPNGGTYGQNLALLRAMGAIPEKGPIQLIEAVFR